MSLEMNKIGAAVLTGGIVAMLSGFVASHLYHPHELEKPAFAVALPDADAGSTEPAKPSLEPILPLLASADVEAGKNETRACQACHSFDKGGPNKIGPNLWGIVGSEPAEVAGYSFSDAMQKLEEEHKAWTYSNLNAFLNNPQEYAPGTKMTYAGVKNTKKRANVIAYLRTLSDDPVALPTEAEIEAVTKTEKAEADAATEQQAATSDGAASGDEGKTEVAASGGSTAAAASGGGSGGADLGKLIGEADPAAGQKVARQCTACHSFEKGGPNKIGPNLYDIIGEKAGEREGYNFSKAMEEKGAEGYSWTYQHLFDYLENPRKVVPGTKMTFAGLRKPEQRAEVIAYIRSLAENPPPLPK